MKKTILLALLVLMGVGILNAQTRVTGTVTGADDGQPLPFVTVSVKGTTVTALTGNDGKYAINVPAGSETLMFSFAGMKTLEIPVGGRAVIDAMLEADVALLDEAIIVAYGTAKKSSFTGAAQVMKSEDLERRQSSNISSTLQGAVSGVKVVTATAQPGEEANIRIRGTGSLNNNAEPLWVIDGVPYEGLTSAINQDDIESMTVLKDAASTALYGARAANGVILVTTKKGRKGAAPSVNFRASWGVSSRAVKEYKKLGARESLEMEWEALYNQERYSNSKSDADARTSASSGLLNRIKYNPVRGVTEPVGRDGKVAGELMWDEDWFDTLTEDAPLRQDYQISVSGGTDNSNYLVSMGYLDEKGVTLTSYFKRYTARSNVNFTVKKWFDTGLNMAIAYQKQGYPTQYNTSSFINPYTWSRLVSPIYPAFRRDANGNEMYDENGDRIPDTGDWQSSSNWYRPVADGGNPRAAMQYQSTKNTRWSIDPTWYADVKFADWLSLRTTVAINNWDRDGDQSYSRRFGDAKDLGRIYKYRNSSLTYTVNEVLTFNKTFADVHTLSATLGHENSLLRYKYLVGQKTGTYSDDIPEWNMAVTNQTMESYTTMFAREGYFGRISYDFDGKYFVEGSLRRDASSRFHKDERWGTFWSASAGWRIVKEDFMKNLTFVDDLKLRGSYGVKGNDVFLNAGVYTNRDESYNYFPYMGLAEGGYNNTGLPGYYYNQIGNPGLTWEQKKSLNIGLDYGFLGRIYGSIDFFLDKVEDMGFRVPLAPSVGFNSYQANSGDMKNTGIEFEITGSIFKNSKMEVGASLNAAYIKNEITHIPFDDGYITGNKRWLEGHSFSEYYIYDWAGVDPTDGRPMWWANDVDASGNIVGRKQVYSTSNATKYFMGDATPHTTLGFSPYFNGFGFDVSMTITGEFGHSILDGAYSTLMHDGYRAGYAWHEDILNRWTESNPYTDVPKLLAGQSSTSANATSSRFLYKADYLRLSAFTVGYTLPKALVSKLGLGKVRVYVQGDKMLTVKLRDMPDGADPESMTGEAGYGSTGSRVISGGIQISF